MKFISALCSIGFNVLALRASLPNAGPDAIGDANPVYSDRYDYTMAVAAAEEAGVTLEPESWHIFKVTWPYGHYKRPDGPPEGWSGDQPDWDALQRKVGFDHCGVVVGKVMVYEETSGDGDTTIYIRTLSAGLAHQAKVGRLEIGGPLHVAEDAIRDFDATKAKEKKQKLAYVMATDSDHANPKRLQELVSGHIREHPILNANTNNCVQFYEYIIAHLRLESPL